MVEIGLIGAVLFGAFACGKLYRWLRALSGVMTPPVRMTLRPCENPSWTRPRWVKERHRELEDSGFRHFASYRVLEMPYYFLSAFVDRQCVAAVIYDYPLVAGYVDLFARHGSRGGLTVSTAPFAGRISAPPWATRVCLPKVDIPTMLHLFRQASGSIPADSWVPLTPDNFVSSFEEFAADETDWRNATGGLSLEEVASLSSRPLSPRALEKLWGEQRQKALANFEEGMRRRILERVPEAASWTSAELLSVHPELSMDWLLQRLDQHSDRPRKSPVRLPEDCPIDSALSAFEWIQAWLPEDRRYRLVGELNYPAPTAVYRKPEAGVPRSLLG